MPEIKLIVTDLDDTLFGNDNEFSSCMQLADVIGTYRERHGAVWAICSGRSKRSVRPSIEKLQKMGLDPDYVVVRGTFFYALTRLHLHPLRKWNWGVRVHKLMTVFVLRRALRDWRREVSSKFKNVLCLYQRGTRLCLRFRNRLDADAGAALLRRKAKLFQHLQVYQHLSEVEVRGTSYSKGLAVEVLAGHLGITRSETLCIGDGTSDLSMLNGSFAMHTGCPVNADVDVMKQVHEMHGYIAEGRSMVGVVQILEGYLRGEIQSDLPDWWSASQITQRARMGGIRTRHHHHHARSQRSTILIGFLTAYTVLVVFANFGLVPFSRLIMKPFVILLGLMARLVEYVM